MKRLIMTSFLLVMFSSLFSQTVFTYQGQLLSSGVPVNTSQPVNFKLFDAAIGGTQIGSTLAQTINPSNGLFTTKLDFGSNAFISTNRYLEITVNGSTLTPRQQITPTPMAYSLVLPFTGTASGGDAIHITSTGINGIYSEVDTVGGTGLYGLHNAATGSTPGVFGATNSTDFGANAVYGIVSSSSAGSLSAGVRGVNNGTGLAGIGVYGSHAGGGYGVYGTSISGYGVYGISNTSIGVYASSTSGYGLTAYSNSSTGIFVTSGTGDALYAYSPGGTGLYGVSNNFPGVHGTTINDIGVFGEHTASTGTAAGVQGSTNSTDAYAYGVYGVVTSTSPGFFSSGVRGENKSTSGLGIGVSGSHNGNGYGVYGTSVTGDAVYGYASGGYGVVGISGSSTGSGIYGSGTGIASNSGAALYAYGNFQMSAGAFKASPTTTQWTTNKPATVKLQDGTQVKLFAEEAAEVYFNDYGDGQLQNGRAHIALDPRFVQTVTIDETHSLRVFIQLEGDSDGVYVTNKSNSGFDVVERHNGTSNVSFSYRIVCKRKFYEDERLATQDEDISFNTRMLNQVWPEQMEQAKRVAAQGQNSRPK